MILIYMCYILYKCLNNRLNDDSTQNNAKSTKTYNNLELIEEQQ
jgi:hypothetical protein